MKPLVKYNSVEISHFVHIDNFSTIRGVRT